MKLDTRERTYAWRDPSPTVAAGVAHAGRLRSVHDTHPTTLQARLPVARSSQPWGSR